MTSLIFTVSSLLTKYLTGPTCGFDPVNISFASYAFIGFFLALGLLYHSITDSFSFPTLVLGTLGGVINTIGIVLFNKAYSIGPLGSVAALGCI